MRDRLIPIMLAGVLAAGCGDGAAGPDLQQTFATIRARINLHSVPVQQAPRIALVWAKHISGDFNLAEDHQLYTSQEFEVSNSSPTSFELSLTELPPREAFIYFSPEDIADNGYAPGSGFAMGQMIVYSDYNGNEKLDFTPSTSPDFVDGLLGHAMHGENSVMSTYKVFYWEGEPPPPDSWPGQIGLIQQGYNLSYYKQSNTHKYWKINQVFLPLDTEVQIILEGDPVLSCFLVQPRPLNLTTSLDTPIHRNIFRCANNQPLQDATEVRCIPGLPSMYDSIVVKTASPKIMDLCGPVRDACVVYADRDNELELPDPPPPGWPCPADG